MAKSKVGILVTGDCGPDYDIYLHSESDNPPPGTPPPVIRAAPGGAGLISRILNQVEQLSPDLQKAGGVTCGIDTDKCQTTVAATWIASPIGQFGKNQKEQVWRTKRSLSLGNVVQQTGGQVPRCDIEHFAPSSAEEYSCKTLVIDDNGAGFRTNVPTEFEAFLKSKATGLPKLIILKTGAPICRGPLWWSLTSSSSLADRLMVIVPIKDLRRANVRISQGISWERTFEDLVRELKHSSALADLRSARHVLITLHGEGVLWMQRVPGNAKQLSFSAVYDPAHMEEEWSSAAVPSGDAYGFHSAFVAAIATQCAVSPGEDFETAIEVGISRGIFSMRALKVIGHGVTQQEHPGIPAEILAQVITSKEPRINSTPDIDWAGLGALTKVGIPTEPNKDAMWRILESTEGVGRGSPLYGKALRIALFGLKQLGDTPHARFGGLVTADRAEIEALRNLKNLVASYKSDRRVNTPLSLAVFGPPGSGKSFGIKQIAKSVVEKHEQAFLEFNLSQFSNPSDLIGAFHQIRDAVLDGKLPVVFWDEFDSKNYMWLQYLLAPMQDGKFQEGQITHPIGRCIFVFAGATSFSFEDFGPPKPLDPSTYKGKLTKEDIGELNRQRREAESDFRLKKGPDFKSRIHGYLNVLGTNRRRIFDGLTWKDDESDICFPVRRAILLRSLLGYMGGKKQKDRLPIDSAMLIALITISEYRYGARSMEKILKSLNAVGSEKFHRSNLPTDEVLELNLGDLDEFKEHINGMQILEQHMETLAPAVHAAWFDKADRANAYRVGFAELSPESRSDNYEAVRRIPFLLALVGLELVKPDSKPPSGRKATSLSTSKLKDILETHMELLAEEEHVLWREVKEQNGWTYVKTRDDKNRTHNCLVAYKELPEKERDKDRMSIRNFPIVADLAGFAIVPRSCPLR